MKVGMPFFKASSQIRNVFSLLLLSMMFTMGFSFMFSIYKLLNFFFLNNRQVLTFVIWFFCIYGDVINVEHFYL